MNFLFYNSKEDRLLTTHWLGYSWTCGYQMKVINRAKATAQWLAVLVKARSSEL